MTKTVFNAGRVVFATLALFFMFTLAGCSSSEFKIPERPIDTTVYDPNDYLSKETEKEIDELNNGWLNSKDQFQMGVVVVDSLNGRDLEDTALQIARKWGIGEAKTKRGSLLLVAIEDRDIRIETSDEVATKLTDSIASEIIDRAGDAMRDENYDKGVLGIVKDSGSYFTEGKLEERKDGDDTAAIWLLVIIVVVVALAVIADVGTGGSILYLGGSSGSSGRSGGSGGGFSGGGGGFSGGGASGGW